VSKISSLIWLFAVTMMTSVMGSTLSYHMLNIDDL
jgi:hypothetical protein